MTWLQLAAQADYGFEPNRFGTAKWYAGALAARAKAFDWLYLVARGDRFYEQLASDATGTSAPLFWNGHRELNRRGYSRRQRQRDVTVRAERTEPGDAPARCDGVVLSRAIQHRGS